MILIRKFKGGGPAGEKRGKQVGTNSFTYDPETETYNPRYSLEEVKIPGDRKKYNPVGQNVSAAENRFAMNYLYPAMLGAGGLGAANTMFTNVPNGMMQLLLGHFYGLGIGAGIDRARARGSFNPLIPIPEGADVDDASFYNPYSRRYFNKLERKEVK